VRLIIKTALFSLLFAVSVARGAHSAGLVTFHTGLEIGTFGAGATEREDIEGCKPDSQSINVICKCIDGKASVPHNPEWRGSTFGGWKGLTKGTTEVSCNPAEDKRYDAIWIENSESESVAVDGTGDENRMAALWKSLPKAGPDGWRDKDGNFNQTRLLADAAGGAVVGAAAGILTNIAMKKAQLKKGYESIQCVYGTAGHAAFGEQFIVQ
jgi:hypothetical protein